MRRGTYRLYEVIRHGTWVGIAAHAAFIPVFSALNLSVLAAFNVLSVGSWVLARVLNQRGHQSLAMVVLSVEVIAHAILAVSYTGWECGFQYHLLPLVSFFTFNERWSLRQTLGASLGVIAVLAWLEATYRSVSLGLSPSWLTALHTANLALPLLAVFITSFYYRRASLFAERRLDELASHDPLTGLLNRRRMLERLRERRREFERRKRPFALVMLDVDHFKSVNDGHGHDAGDRVLKELSQTLGTQLRGEDVFCRWGGEEFLILLPETKMIGALFVAEKLRRLVERHDFSVPGAALRVTVTCGVAVFEGEGTLEQAIQRADAALYAGKSNGRNRVEPR